MAAHDASEVCVIQIDYNDSFNSDRVDFYGVSAWPTIAGNGLADVWPIDCIEEDYEVNAAVPSPLSLMITEDGMGSYTAHITAEEDVVGASFYMVVTLDEWVPGAEGMSHLPHHVKQFLTSTTGDAFTLMAGETVAINHTFEMQPGWDFDLMGVAAWVSRSGGTNISPCPYGSLPNGNEVLQARWVPAANVTRTETTSWSHLKSMFR